MFASVSNADFNGPAYVQAEYNYRCFALAFPFYGEWLVAMGAGTFDNRIGYVFYAIKYLMVAAINLTEVKMAQLVMYFGEKMNGWAARPNISTTPLGFRWLII